LSSSQPWKTPVEPEAEATQATVGVRPECNVMKGSAQAGLEVARHSIDPVQLLSLLGVFSTGNDSIKLAVCVGDSPKAGQSVAEQARQGFLRADSKSQ
jgi:hypothetical protein